jgi:hypothetical protein
MDPAPPRLTLHIGTPKSGTTYLQAILAAGRDELESRGILYPGRRYLPQEGFNQQPAIYALGRRHIGWLSEEARENAEHWLPRLSSEVAGHSGRVLLSAESLAFFVHDEIEELLRTLHVTPEQVHVVITGRDLGRILPSIWQQNVKNGAVQEMEAYLDSVRDLRERPNIPMWTAFGLPGLVERWAEVVGMERVTLVTAPHGRGTALWERYATACDIPTDLPERTGTGTRKDDNTSLTRGQAELLRAINAQMKAAEWEHARAQKVRGRLLNTWMSADLARGTRIVLPPHLRPDVEKWCVEDIARLRDTGVRVVGDLADLDLAPPRAETEPATGARPDGMPDIDEIARDVLLVLATLPGSGRRRGPATTARRVARALRTRGRALIR